MKKSASPIAMTFGDALRFSSDKSVAYHVSRDKQAFDIKFDKPPAAAVGRVGFAGVAKSGAPINTRGYSVVIPAAGKNVKTTFFVNGFGSTAPGTSALLMLSVNGQHRVTRFAANKKDQDFVVALPFKAKAVDDIRIHVTLLAERDTRHSDAAALLVINDITTDSALAPKAMRRRGARATTK